MLIYNLGVKIYGFLIRLSAFRNQKAREWVSGRKGWELWLETKIKSLPPGPRIWMHCASYGEFEQGRPLAEAIVKQYGQNSLILTFFSPSGYLAFKNWEGAAHVAYLPLDSPVNARKFVGLLKPSLAVFIKYEFWVNYLFELKKNNIPTFLVSAVFKPHHPFFKWYGGVFRNSLSAFNTMFLQDGKSASMLQDIGISNYVVCGDTRFDRVVEVKNSFTHITKIKDFRNNRSLIAAGSTWSGDEELVIEAFLNTQAAGRDFCLLLAPHEIDEQNIKQTCSRIEKAGLRYALYTDDMKINNVQVLVLNTMGMLSRSYYYADVAYIGGGFNGGLHNTLEAAVYGIPVTFYGDNSHRYNEVEEMIKLGVAHKVQNAKELAEYWDKTISGANKVAKEILEDFFLKNSNATGKIMEAIKSYM